MRRLAVALTLTLPMMVPLARSALAAKPTHQRMPSTPLLLEASSEPSPWSDDADDPQ
jgi:hypothetical protein